MSPRNVLFVVTILLAVALLAHGATAQVVVFERYATIATVADGSIHIERDVRIKNNGQAPIIPGELHFRLYERRGGEKYPLPVTDFSAETARGETLSTKVSERRGETDLSVQLWNPLLPGFHEDFTMSYELTFEPSGILFYEIRLPQEETTIPISNEQTVFQLADKYHVTYAPGSVVSSLSGNTVVEWENTDDQRVVEYSRLPLPRIPVRAVNVFWLIIIALLIGFFVLSIRRTKPSPQTQQPAGGQWQQYPQQPQQQQYGPRYGGGR